MNTLRSLVAVLFLVVLAGCAGRSGESATEAVPTGQASASGKAVVALSASDEDDWDDTADVKVHDPIEPVNRGVFWFNHQLYTYIAKPFSTAYEFIFPDLVRRGIRNAYDNVRFPVRFVNHTLQGRLDRTVQETGKFVLNTTAGVGGLMKPSDKIPALADVPRSDTGQTFAKWGVPHGPYLVFPVLGPTTCRELVGTAGDTALNPISWLSLLFPGAAWTMGVSTPAGAHSVPEQMDTYDTATKDALDPYISARTGYIQYRNAAAER
jgi:phospholipid-binding lipoprotein MlaA